MGDHQRVNHYGEFVQEDCFELRRTPPRPWTNVHHNGLSGVQYSASVTSLGSGPRRLRMPDGRKVNFTGHEDTYIYIRDDATLETFCPGGGPVITPVTDLRVRYWPAKTELSSTCSGLRATQRVFVPREHPFELWTVTVENKTDQPRQISVFAYANFAFANRSDIRADLRGVYVTHYDAVTPDEASRGFLCVAGQGYYAATGRRDSFLRPDLSTATPKIMSGGDLDNRPGHLFWTRGVVQAKVSLEPGEQKRVDFLLGYARSPEEVAGLLRELRPERIDALCDDQERFERERADTFKVDIGDANLNALMNGFVKKQLISYLANKNGFRDNLQVILALSMADYSMCEQVLLHALTSQHSEGWAPHSYRPLNDRRFSDKPAWIAMTVAALIKESGDFSLLEREVAYQDGARGSVWDHLLRAMRFLAKDTRKHGLCDLREGDWNDGLQPTGGDTGGRESVMVTEQFCHGLLETAELAQRIGESAVAEEAKELHREFSRRLNEVAWDGQWYQRVLCDDGFVIGTHKEPEAKIFTNTQAWAVLGGVAPPDRAKLCMDMVEKHCMLDIGYRVCYPPFSKYDARVGHSSTMPPGVIENGGCYNHAAGFKVVADCVLGRAEQAWDTFRKVAPDNPENPVSRSKAEPFSFVNLFFADERTYGEALYPWNTGTAAWFTLALVEWILGARRDYDGLRIDPCLTRRVPRARVVRPFRGATYDIHLDNTAGRCTGVTSIHLDGEAVCGQVLPQLRSGTHRVDVII